MLTEKSAGPDVAEVKFKHNIPSDSRSFTTALDVLKGTVDKCQDNSIKTLTENDYEHWWCCSARLMDIVQDK